MARCKDGPFNLTCQFCGTGFLAWTKQRDYCDNGPCKKKSEKIKGWAKLQPRVVNLEQFRRSVLVRDLERRSLSAAQKEG